MSAIQVSAFRWVPPFAQGLVRDLRVRWALGEAGLDYDERLIDREDQKTEAYRRLQPFGQVPALVEGDQVLFESGAIVLRVAERSPALMPDDAHAREQVRTDVRGAEHDRLRILRTTDLVARRPTLDAYKQRFEARPAFQKALAAQLAAFEANAPAGPAR